jgi:hypothetical protein
VPEVHAIEITDGRGTDPVTGTQVMNTANKFHQDPAGLPQNQPG